MENTQRTERKSWLSELSDKIQERDNEEQILSTRRADTQKYVRRLVYDVVKNLAPSIALGLWKPGWGVALGVLSLPGLLKELGEDYSFYRICKRYELNSSERIEELNYRIHGNRPPVCRDNGVGA